MHITMEKHRNHISFNVTYQPIPKYPRSKVQAPHIWYFENPISNTIVCQHNGITYLFTKVPPSHPTFNHLKKYINAHKLLPSYSSRYEAATLCQINDAACIWMHMNLLSYQSRYEAASLCPINDVVPVRSEPQVRDITLYANAIQCNMIQCHKIDAITK